MAWVIVTPNRFDPFHSTRHEVNAGTTIRQWVREYCGADDFESPTICVYNGKALMRKDWDREIEDDAIVNFIAVPGGLEPATIIAIVSIAITVISVVASFLLIPKPKNPGEQPASDPVFSTKGQENQIRLGEPIECNYGRNRIYPSYAARPYFQYINNDQIQYAVFCLGQGEYDLDSLVVQIGDTAAANFEEFEYEYVPPGAKVTLFPTNVRTAPEVGGQELLAPNEEEYVPDGWVGPFVANVAGTEAYRIEVDIVMPQGLYSVSSKGGIRTKSVQVQFQAREIDSAGDPLGDWIDLFAGKKTETYVSTKHLSHLGHNVFRTTWSWVLVSTVWETVETNDPAEGTITTTYSDANSSDDPANREGVTKTVETILEDAAFVTVTEATTTPQRRTFGTTITPSRYEVRSRRRDDKDTSTRAGHQVVWDGLRSFIDSEQNYGDVTLLATTIRATSNLNQNTQDRLNVIATRKLHLLDTGQFTTETYATRGIVPAFIDVFRSSYGGRTVDEMFFDVETLEALDAFYESRNEHFDWQFRDPITVWEAAQTIARVGRAVASPAGARFTMKRDSDVSLPVAMFGRENIVKGSFKYEIKLWDLDEFDSVRILYTDVSEGYAETPVVCTLPGGTTDNPEDLRFIGIQDRDHAYHEGLVYLASKKYRRQKLSFTTGMEGFIPTYGDLIALSHDLFPPEWRQSGFVVHAEETDPGSYTLWISAPLTFTEGSNHQIRLRGAQGQVIGPLTAFETTDPQQVIVEISDEIADTDFSFLLGGQGEPMIFQFGVQNNIAKLAKVLSVAHRGEETIDVQCVNDSPIIHTFDELEAPELDLPSTAPSVPDLPVVRNVRISQVAGLDKIVQVSWTAAFGALYYVVQTSTDGTNWNSQGTTVNTSIQLQAPFGTFYVRVAAVNLGQGPWDSDMISIGIMAGLENHELWDHETFFGVRYWQVLNSTGYNVKIYRNDQTAPVLLRSEDVALDVYSYSYTLDDMLNDDATTTREVYIEVDAFFQDEDSGGVSLSGTPSTLELSNSIPSPPTNVQAVFLSNDSDGRSYTISWDNPEENDLHKVCVWLELISGFDPEAEACYYEEQSSDVGYTNLSESTVIEIPFDSGSGGHPAHYVRVAVFDVYGNEISTNVSAEIEIPAYVP